MLTAEEVLERHPQGCWVFDAHGRRLGGARGVFACNPITGEAVLCCQVWSPLAWLFSLLPRPRPTWWWIYPIEVPRRHGFWPAPLRLVPRRGKEWIGSEMRRRGELAAERLRDVLAELADTSSTLPATPEEHEQLCDAIAARRQAGDPIPPGQPYIVGNGDPEVLL